MRKGSTKIASFQPVTRYSRNLMIQRGVVIERIVGGVLP